MSRFSLGVLRPAALMLVTLFAAAPLSATMVSIDFDNVPGGGTLAPNTILTDQYSSLGVAFTAFENGNVATSAVINTFIFSDYPQREGNYWGNVPLGTDRVNRRDTMRMTFSSPVHSVQWLLQSHGADPVLFEAFDVAGNLLETFSSVGDFTLVGFSATNISRIDGHQAFENMLWGMDNLRFDTSPLADPPPPAPVPAPGAGLLFVLGIAALRLGAMLRPAMC